MTDLVDYHTLLFEPEPFNLFFSLEELFPYEEYLYFAYDAFTDLSWDFPNADSPWHQYYCDSAKAGIMLEVDDPMLRE
jgi:hypothetical protein